MRNGNDEKTPLLTNSDIDAILRASAVAERDSARFPMTHVTLFSEEDDESNSHNELKYEVKEQPIREYKRNTNPDIGYALPVLTRSNGDDAIHALFGTKNQRFYECTPIEVKNIRARLNETILGVAHDLKDAKEQSKNLIEEGIFKTVCSLKEINLTASSSLAIVNNKFWDYLADENNPAHTYWKKLTDGETGKKLKTYLEDFEASDESKSEDFQKRFLKVYVATKDYPNGLKSLLEDHQNTAIDSFLKYSEKNFQSQEKAEGGYYKSNQSQLMEEYAALVNQAQYKLLPCDLKLLALIYDIELHLYTAIELQPEKIGGKTGPVSILYGDSCFKRMEKDTVAYQELLPEPSDEKKASPPRNLTYSQYFYGLWTGMLAGVKRLFYETLPPDNIQVGQGNIPDPFDDIDLIDHALERGEKPRIINRLTTFILHTNALNDERRVNVEQLEHERKVQEDQKDCFSKISMKLYSCTKNSGPRWSAWIFTLGGITTLAVAIHLMLKTYDGYIAGSNSVENNQQLYNITTDLLHWTHSVNPVISIAAVLVLSMIPEWIRFRNLRYQQAEDRSIIDMLGQNCRSLERRVESLENRQSDYVELLTLQSVELLEKKDQIDKLKKRVDILSLSYPESKGTHESKDNTIANSQGFGAAVTTAALTRFNNLRPTNQTGSSFVNTTASSDSMPAYGRPSSYRSSSSLFSSSIPPSESSRAPFSISTSTFSSSSQPSSLLSFTNSSRSSSSGTSFQSSTSSFSSSRTSSTLSPILFAQNIRRPPSPPVFSIQSSSSLTNSGSSSSSS